MEAAFPEALKGPILRKVQFQTISRLDNLVDMVYDEFKADFYPGEDVFVTLDEFNNERRPVSCARRQPLVPEYYQTGPALSLQAGIWLFSAVDLGKSRL